MAPAPSGTAPPTGTLPGVEAGVARAIRRSHSMDLSFPCPGTSAMLQLVMHSRVRRCQEQGDRFFLLPKNRDY